MICLSRSWYAASYFAFSICSLTRASSSSFLFRAWLALYFASASSYRRFISDACCSAFCFRLVSSRLTAAASNRSSLCKTVCENSSIRTLSVRKARIRLVINGLLRIWLTLGRRVGSTASMAANSRLRS